MIKLKKNKIIDSNNINKDISNYIQNNSNNNFYDFKKMYDYLIEFNYFSFIFTFIILNIYIAIYLTKIDLNKYLDPNSKNKLIKLLRYLINRYINLYKSTNFLFIFSWICLFISLLMSKLCLFFLKN